MDTLLWRGFVVFSALSRAFASLASPLAAGGAGGTTRAAVAIQERADTSGTILQYLGRSAGRAVKPGTELRILCVGDSITVGFASEQNGGDANGYRLELRNNLSQDKVVYAGNVTTGTMDDGYFAAWSGQTIQYIADNIGPSLQHRPNIVLVHAGTNDMNPDPNISKQGNDPGQAADRLGNLIDQILAACPDATVLVAQIINTCDSNQEPQTQVFQSKIATMIGARFASKHVLGVNFTTFPISMLRDCIHPTNPGYRLFGDYWYDFSAPTGINANGGLDAGIPSPDVGATPVTTSSPAAISLAFQNSLHQGGDGANRICIASPSWFSTGKIALGLGRDGDWKYQQNWVQAGKVADGIGKDSRYVRLHDMNGDGKADYVWLDPVTGEIRCWLNNLPQAWSPAGTNNSIIGSGVGPEESIFIADMNGDGLEDYLAVTPNTGAVRIWWNYGADSGWANGWKFVEGGVIATGVPHANWETLHFPDINGDGRADYVVVGQGGALRHFMNTGSAGGQDVLFLAQGGIATGAASDISKLVFADMDGDGRDDYLIWDDQGGLTGYLNQEAYKEGVPVYVSQGPAKSVAGGIMQAPSSIRLADMDGDGKDDYAYIDEAGALWLWYNRGVTNDSMGLDGLRLADIDGDGYDDYVWLDPVSGAPTVYLNNVGPASGDVLGWGWSALNGGKPIASGAAPASKVQFGDINGDGKDDYLVLDPKTGELTVYLNGGPSSGSNGWTWNSIGSIASGLGPGANVRFADIDGDGYDDYIFLHPNGGTTIYRNVYSPNTPDSDWRAMPGADASGIGQRPEEITFADINGDGKADYIWTSVIDGSVNVWLNNYPNTPTWLAQGKVHNGIAPSSGANVRYANIGRTGRADYVVADAHSASIAVWLNGCSSPGDPKPAKTPH
ncbi:integrin alpha N-terminal domain-containing protein [Thozetella sp. PMI_491]|nr:integrin alpha N-terminal domain-containing protein [Thozetella sp. PMI_491]